MSDNLQLRAIAEAYGMDPTELRNQATQKIKTKHIDKQLNADYTDEQKSLIYNKAQLDPETKKWMVTMADGTKRDVNDIKENEWVQLMPTEEAIEDHVSKIHDLLAQTLGAQNYSNAVLADGTKEILTEEQKKRIDNSLTLVHENYETTSNLIRLGAEHATSSQKNANDALIESTAAVTLMFSNMELAQKDTIKKLKELTGGSGELYDALKLVEAELTGNEGAVQHFTNKILEAAKALVDLAGAAGTAGEKTSGPGNFEKGSYQIQDANGYKWRDALKEFEQAIVEDKPYEELKKIYETKLNANDGKRNFGEYLHEHLGWTTGDSFDEVYKAKDKIVGLNAKMEEWDKGAPERLQKAQEAFASYNEQWQQKYGVLTNNKQQNTNPFQFQPSNNSIVKFKESKVNDGMIGVTEIAANDSALIAQPGGPFDTLFNKVFSKVDNIYNSLAGNGGSTQSIAPIQLNINGELNLKSDGQSVDLLGMIQNNPTFLATMSQMIVTQLSKNVNGGKTSMFDWLRSIK